MHLAEWVTTFLGSALDQPKWLLVLAMIGAALVSEDVTLGLTLAAASLGKLSYGFVAWANFLAITIGDLTIYGIGYAFRKKIDKERMDLGQRLYKRYGTWIVVVTRVLPGSRSTAYLVAGIVRAPIVSFVTASLMSVAVWLTLIVWLAQKLTPLQLAISFLVVMGMLFVIQRVILRGLRNMRKSSNKVLQ